MKAKKVLITGLCSLLGLASCNSTKNNVEEKASEEVLKINQTLLKEGFTYGTMVHSTEEGDCQWTIALESGIYYDPINLEDVYKTEGVTLYFKFRPLRRASRCNKANPIELEEVKKN